jgi:hypothetical protein
VEVVTRRKDSVKKVTAEVVERLYTPERATVMGRLAGRLWGEMRAWLGALETELTWPGGGGEAPVQACRTRVRMMRGAMQGLGPDHRRLCKEAGDDLEAWRWLDEFSRPMEGWLKALEEDLKEIGTTPQGEAPRDDTWFTPEYAIALGSLQEVYRDWWSVAWPLAGIEAPDVSPQNIEHIDARLKFVATRMHARRPALKAMPGRDMSWVAS